MVLPRVCIKIVKLLYIQQLYNNLILAIMEPHTKEVNYGDSND